MQHILKIIADKLGFVEKTRHRKMFGENWKGIDKNYVIIPENDTLLMDGPVMGTKETRPGFNRPGINFC